MLLPGLINRKVTERLPLKPLFSRLSAPLASITFDDFPRSAWTVGGEILARRQVKATYYVSGGYCGHAHGGVDYFDQKDLVEVASAGHEIGSHSFEHERGPSTLTDLLIDDAERNAAFVEDVLGDYVMTSFAYPFGEASPRTKTVLGERFPTCRGIVRGVNHGLMDLSQLKAIGLEHGRWSQKRIENAIRKAVSDRAWVIFFTHDVSETPTPFGATPGMLTHALDCLAGAGIEILPVRHALARAAFG